MEERTSQYRDTVQNESDGKTDGSCTSRDISTSCTQKSSRRIDISVWNVFRAERSREWSRVV
jgi:hypothetical protein